MTSHSLPRCFTSALAVLVALAAVHAVAHAAEEDWVTVAQPGESNVLPAATESDRIWYADWRVQQMFDSRTSYQFGTAPESLRQWAPLSKLDWSLDSTWTGVRLGVKRPTWDVHCEWLTPMVRGINGNMSDYDWGIAASQDPTSLDSLSVSPERWLDGQKLEVEEEFLWSNCFLGMPVELWPLAGFRWQRFDMMAYNGLQVINNAPPPEVGYRWDEDMVSFNQQYYMAYLGGQLRKTIERAAAPPITLVIQADYGFTAGYNVDHHISGYEADGIHRYTMESTAGDVFHVALTADVPFNKHLAVGAQVDHTQIHTTGTHHWVMSGAATADERWDNGVVVMSQQTSATGYVRCCW
ncbi:MAG: omptin family outer membrane protease [Thermoguttaceae bacterium]